MLSKSFTHLGLSSPQLDKNLNLMRNSTWWEPQLDENLNLTKTSGHFAMKFINLRRPGSKPVFVVLPSENKKYTFYINNVKVHLFVCLFVNCNILVKFAISGLSSKKSNPGELEERHNHGAARRAWGRSTHQVRAEKPDLQLAICNISICHLKFCNNRKISYY